MLNPNSNRLDYGSILSAPLNYELDFAIGTTYSLDLDSLVGASISLGLSEETDTILSNNPIFLLEALRATGDKIALFCENGRISLPSNPTKLYILLEKMVFQVNAPEKEKFIKYPSFHPKFWLIRYINEEKDVIYRVIVLSRNLTYDRSWDISFSMEGKKIENNLNSDKNNNLIIFLDYLKEFSTDSNKTEKIDKIIEELNHVEFDLNSNIFEDFDFIPNGVSEDVSIKKYPLFDESFDDLVIISPFLSKGIIREFNQRVKNYKSYQKSINDPKITRLYLFSRAESLSKLKYDDCDEFKIYTLKDQIVDGEFTISGDSDVTEHINESEIDESGKGQQESQVYEDDFGLNQRQNIHAKVYFVRKGSQVDLYLGSLNASHNAVSGNVEFMIRLKTNNGKFNLNKLLNDLFCGDEGGPESPFQSFDVNKYDGGDVDEGKDLDSILKNIVRLTFKSKISWDNEFYKINLNVEDFSIFEDKYGKDLDISIKPLLSEKVAKFSKEMTFEKLNKIQLSSFFAITIKDDEDSINRIIKIETLGMPTDREKEVISSVVNDKTAFIRYVAFLLGDNYILSALETGILNKTWKINSNNSIHIQLPALYEKMLNASVNDKEKFREVDYLIQTLSDDDVIPEGFEELYNTFKEVIDNE